MRLFHGPICLLYKKENMNKLTQITSYVYSIGNFEDFDGFF